jgi:hypothetical protein
MQNNFKNPEIPLDFFVVKLAKSQKIVYYE